MREPNRRPLKQPVRSILHAGFDSVVAAASTPILASSERRVIHTKPGMKDASEGGGSVTQLNRFRHGRSITGLQSILHESIRSWLQRHRQSSSKHPDTLRATCHILQSLIDSFFSEFAIGGSLKQQPINEYKFDLCTSIPSTPHHCSHGSIDSQSTHSRSTRCLRPLPRVDSHQLRQASHVRKYIHFCSCLVFTPT